MIKNAQEAREILQHKHCKVWTCFICHEDDSTLAKGYLAALNGPEVKALVEALEKIDKEGPTSCDYNGGCTGFCVGVSRSALAQYRAAAKEIK